MDNDVSFMKVIDNFDKCLKGDISEEAREYCEAMKKIFMSIEQTNINFQKVFKEMLGEKEITN